MYGYISGFADNDDVYYCPKCGEDNITYHGDGTCTCEECGFRFAVVETEDEDE